MRWSIWKTVGQKKMFYSSVCLEYLFFSHQWYFIGFLIATAEIFSSALLHIKILQCSLFCSCPLFFSLLLPTACVTKFLTTGWSSQYGPRPYWWYSLFWSMVAETTVLGSKEWSVVDSMWCFIWSFTDSMSVSRSGGSCQNITRWRINKLCIWLLWFPPADQWYKRKSHPTIERVQRRLNHSREVSVEFRNPYPHSDCNLERGGLCLNATLRNWIRFYVPKGSELISFAGSKKKIQTKK